MLARRGLARDGRELVLSPAIDQGVASSPVAIMNVP